MSLIKALTPVDKFGVGASDLGIARELPSGRTAFIFGDTFEEHRVGGKGWRSPVILYSSTKNLAAGIEFDSAVGGDYARQIFAYERGKEFSTILPTDAIVIEGRLYLHVMVTRGLGNELRTELHVSDDEGETWSGPLFRLPASDHDGNRVMWTMERGDDGWIYIITTGGLRRDRNAYLWRVREDKFAVPSAYVPWGWAQDSWQWGIGPTPILPAGTRCGEVNLRRVENKWVFTCFEESKYCITVRVLDDPTDDMHTALMFRPISGPGGRGGPDILDQLYGGYVIPGSALDDLHLVVSQWNTRTNWPYRVVQYRADLHGWSTRSNPASDLLARLRSMIGR